MFYVKCTNTYLQQLLTFLRNHYSKFIDWFFQHYDNAKAVFIQYYNKITHNIVKNNNYCTNRYPKRQRLIQCLHLLRNVKQIALRLMQSIKIQPSKPITILLCQKLPTIGASRSLPTIVMWNGRFAAYLHGWLTATPNGRSRGVAIKKLISLWLHWYT